jgi:hypothetical protein
MLLGVIISLMLVLLCAVFCIGVFCCRNEKDSPERKRKECLNRFMSTPLITDTDFYKKMEEIYGKQKTSK